MTTTSFVCDFCHKHYVREPAFMNHKCPRRARALESRTPLGRAAYLLYAKWMHLRRMGIPPIETFTSSKFYVSFIKLAKFNKAVKLPDIDVYMKIMEGKKIPPNTWSSDAAYAIYLNSVTDHMSYMTAARITSSALLQLAEDYECDVANVFSVVPVTELLQMIRERKLSPWMLLNSSKFHGLLTTCSVMQLDMLETIINVDDWKRRFKENPSGVDAIKSFVRELGI